MALPLMVLNQNFTLESSSPSIIATAHPVAMLDRLTIEEVTTMDIKPDQTEQLVIDGYIEALYFSDTGEGDQPPADAELSEAAKRRITIDCLHFMARYRVYLESDDVIATWEQVGHDIHFTRNGHGVGFWCRPEQYGPYYADMLTKGAEQLGGVHSYLGDDGLIELQ